MTRLKRLGLATAMALMMACALTGSASATTIDPANTAFTLTSTNVSFTILDTAPVTWIACGHSVITGTTPGPGAPTWATFIATTVAYNNCRLDGLALTTVTPSALCQGRVTFDLMGASVTTAAAKMTLPPGCTIEMSVSMLGCTLTITGGQTIGNGTTGSGGVDWTNLGTQSNLHFETATFPYDSTGFTGCPTAGTHTGTLGGDYTVAGATNVTVTP